MTATLRPAIRLESASFSYRTVAIVGSSCLVRSDRTQSSGRPLELGKGDSPGALELDDPVRTEELLEVVDLRRVAVERHRQLVVTDAEDAALEHLHELDDLAADLGCRLHPAQQQFALDGVGGIELADLDDVDQLEQLLRDLLERCRLDVDDD